jgi:hypothetical protein
MDIQTLLRDSRAEKLIDVFGIKTVSGEASFQKQIRLFSSKLSSLERRKKTILSFQTFFQENPEKKEALEGLFQELVDVEKEIQPFFNPSLVEKNSFEQLTFSGYSWAKIFNTVPFLLLLVSYFKLYFVPCLALLSPILMFVAPYFLLKFMYHIDVSTEQYIEIMFQTLGIQSFQMTPRYILQMGLTLFSIVQSIVQPVQNALHLRTIHEDMLKKGDSVLHLYRLYDTIRVNIPSLRSPDFLDESAGDSYRAFAGAWDDPYRLKMMLDYLGDVEVLYRISCSPKIQGVEFYSRETPYLEIREGSDPFLKHAVPFSVRFGKKHHCILTGPNRGGKSSVLRTTLLYVVLAQTYGIGFSYCKLTPFDWIATGLKLEDRPGKSSMFEREVEFSVSILKRAKMSSERGMVFFDELFHSTNPPDGARTAEVFLSSLWKRPNIVSFISTHVFHLAEDAPSHIQKLCVPAKETAKGLRFQYQLQQGICKVSSVDTILKEKGLLVSAETYSPENRQTQKE